SGREKDIGALLKLVLDHGEGTRPPKGSNGRALLLGRAGRGGNRAGARGGILCFQECSTCIGLPQDGLWMAMKITRLDRQALARFPLYSTGNLSIILIASGARSFAAASSHPRQRPLDRRNRERVGKRDLLQAVEAPGRSGVAGVEVDAQHHGV